MTGDSDPLPPDSAGSKSKFAEYGLGQTQARWVAGALDLVIFGDERDVSLAYDPKSGGHNSKLVNKSKPLIETTVRHHCFLERLD